MGQSDIVFFYNGKSQYLINQIYEYNLNRLGGLGLSEAEAEVHAWLGAADTAKQIHGEMEDVMIMIFEKVNSSGAYHMSPEEPDTFLDYLLTKYPTAKGGEVSELNFIITELLPMLKSMEPGRDLIYYIGENKIWWTKIKAAVPFMHEQTRILRDATRAYKAEIESTEKEIGRCERRIASARFPGVKAEFKELKEVAEAKLGKLKANQKDFEDRHEQQFVGQIHKAFELAATKDLPPWGPGSVNERLGGKNITPAKSFIGYYRAIDTNHMEFVVRLPNRFKAVVEKVLWVVDWVEGLPIYKNEPEPEEESTEEVKDGERPEDERVSV